MRRLFLLLIGLLAFGATLPTMPAQAAPAHHHAMPAMPPGHCPDEGQCGAIHICLGCAIDPAEPAPVEPVLTMAKPAPVARLASTLPDHRPGFDPPPPRTA
jgi:hypothetical protein